MTTELWSVGLVLIASILGAFAPIFLKKASHKRFLPIKNLFTNYNLFFAVSLYGAGMVLGIMALRGGELSTLFPLSSLSYLWVTFTGRIYLGERMNKQKWIGIILIIVGVSFIGIGGVQ